MISTCINHQDRTAPDRCKLCLKPICEECQIKVEDSIFCSKECKSKMERQKANIVQTNIQSDLDREKNQEWAPLKALLSFFMLIGGLAVAGYILWIYLLPPNIKEQILTLIKGVTG